VSLHDPHWRHPYLKPQEVRAIEAQLTEAVYDAKRRERLQLLGRQPVPEPSARALDLLDRARQVGSARRARGS
jgi:hypothetical protein